LSQAAFRLSKVLRSLLAKPFLCQVAANWPARRPRTGGGAGVSVKTKPPQSQGETQPLILAGPVADASLSCSQPKHRAFSDCCAGATAPGQLPNGSNVANRRRPQMSHSNCPAGPAPPPGRETAGPGIRSSASAPAAKAPFERPRFRLKKRQTIAALCLVLDKQGGGHRPSQTPGPMNANRRHRPGSGTRLFPLTLHPASPSGSTNHRRPSSGLPACGSLRRTTRWPRADLPVPGHLPMWPWSGAASAASRPAALLAPPKG